MFVHSNFPSFIIKDYHHITFKKNEVFMLCLCVCRDQIINVQTIFAQGIVVWRGHSSCTLCNTIGHLKILIHLTDPFYSMRMNIIMPHNCHKEVKTVKLRLVRQSIIFHLTQQPLYILLASLAIDRFVINHYFFVQVRAAAATK